MKVPKVLGLDLLLKSYLFIPKILFRNVVRRWGDRVQGKTLDVGAGLKPFRDYFQSAEYITLDSDPALKPDVVGDVVALPFPDGTFDSVVCLEVLEHVDKTQRAISELTRVLKPGGTFLVSMPMHWPLHYEPNDFWRITKYGFRVLLSPHYHIEQEEKIGGLFSFLGARIAESAALFLYRLLPFLPKRMRYALGHIANIPLSLVFFLLSLVLDPLFPEDAISWLVVAKKKIIGG